MLRPDGADLFVCRKLTTLSFSQRSAYVRCLLWGQFIRWLFDAGELQQNSREIVLRLIRQNRHGLDGLFKQAGHE